MRRSIRAVMLGVILLLAGACTPQQVIHMTFGSGGSGNANLEGQATRVADCETGGTFNPRAVSPTNDHGLFQINKRYHYNSFQQVTGQPWEKVYDAFWNSVYAKHLYDRQGWQPWTCRYAA